MKNTFPLATVLTAVVFAGCVMDPPTERQQLTFSESVQLDGLYHEDGAVYAAKDGVTVTFSPTQYDVELQVRTTGLDGETTVIDRCVVPAGETTATLRLDEYGLPYTIEAELVVPDSARAAEGGFMTIVVPKAQPTRNDVYMPDPVLFHASFLEYDGSHLTRLRGYRKATYLQSDWTYSYNADGQLERADVFIGGAEEVQLHTYTERGYPSGIEFQNADGVRTGGVTFTYDDLELLTSRYYEFENGFIMEHVMEYDQTGRLLRTRKHWNEEDTAGYIWEYQYDADGRIARTDNYRRTDMSTDASEPDGWTVHTYDDDGIEVSRHTYRADGTLYRRDAYSYGAVPVPSPDRGGLLYDFSAPSSDMVGKTLYVLVVPDGSTMPTGLADLPDGAGVGETTAESQECIVYNAADRQTLWSSELGVTVNAYLWIDMDDDGVINSGDYIREEPGYVTIDMVDNMQRYDQLRYVMEVVE